MMSLIDMSIMSEKWFTILNIHHFSININIYIYKYVFTFVSIDYLES